MQKEGKIYQHCNQIRIKPLLTLAFAKVCVGWEVCACVLIVNFYRLLYRLLLLKIVFFHQTKNA